MIVDLIFSSVGLGDGHLEDNFDITDLWMQYNIGYGFEFGTNGQQSYDKAVEWYRESAEQGNAWSQNRLGECCLNGNGINKDLREAKNGLSQLQHKAMKQHGKI